MAELAGGEDRQGCFPEQGRVKNVRTQWRVFEDGVIANQMQNEEFEHKYGLNRFHRKTVRADIPVARVVQSEEEEERQKKEMRRLERQKQIADEDERIARQMSENLQLETETEQMQRQLEDEERTRQLLAEEEENLRHDEELARQLQEREKEKFERKRLERERRKLEQQIANERYEAERVLAQYRQESQGHQENQHNIATESLQNGAPPDRPGSNSPGTGNNLFLDLDPTIHRPGGQEPEPQPLLPDVQLSTQRAPQTDEPDSPQAKVPDEGKAEERPSPQAQEPDKGKEEPPSPKAQEPKKGKEDDPPPKAKETRKGKGATGEEAYAEVGDFAPVAGQKRNTLNKKGKEKKTTGKNKNSNCKQQ